MVEDKALKAYKSGQRSNVKKHKRRHAREVHLLPDLLVAGGVLMPTFEGPNPGVATYMDAKLHGESTAPLGDYISNTMSNIGPDAVGMAELIIGGLAVKWLGKKTGLNRIGTKGVKLF